MHAARSVHAVPSKGAATVGGTVLSKRYGGVASLLAPLIDIAFGDSLRSGDTKPLTRGNPPA